MLEHEPLEGFVFQLWNSVLPQFMLPVVCSCLELVDACAKKFNKKTEAIEGHGVKITISSKAIHDMLCNPMSYSDDLFVEEWLDALGEDMFRKKNVYEDETKERP